MWQMCERRGPSEVTWKRSCQSQPMVILSSSIATLLPELWRGPVVPQQEPTMLILRPAITTARALQLSILRRSLPRIFGQVLLPRLRSFLRCFGTSDASRGAGCDEVGYPGGSELGLSGNVAGTAEISVKPCRRHGKEWKGGERTVDSVPPPSQNSASRAQTSQIRPRPVQPHV
jgi:hypothetical protein